MIAYEDFAKLELRVAVIKEAADHPNADKLYVLTVDVGDRTKQVVAGIKLHYTKEELVGKLVVIVDNLQPAVLRGVESQGMLLAASQEGALSLVTLQRDIRPGAVVK